MKNNINILFVMFLLLLLCGCIKKETELITNNSQVEYTEITEAYLGESKELTIKGDKDLFVKLYIDGQEVAKDVNGNIRYNLSSLSLGSHNIKVECYVGDEWFEKSWTCKVVEMPVVDNTPSLTYDFPSLTCSVVTESYEGESATITASTETDSKITLYIDGTERLSSTTKELSFDVAALALGTHKIKIVSVNGDKSDKKEFDCKILEVVEEYDYVDLGLPSGTLWATCNVGAKNPWDYGDYFVWGETSPKDVYNASTYKYYTDLVLTKYSIANSGFGCDNLTVLQPEDDAATANLGSNWRMPTEEEWQELLDNCEIDWTSNYQRTGVSGIIILDTHSYTTHIFLPASGYHSDGGSYDVGSRDVYYWSSTLASYHYSARFFSHWGIDSGSRSDGYTVRPVRCRN